MAAKINLLVLSLIFLLGACTKKKAETVQLFYGPCSLEVSSDQKKSEILIDGIKVAKGSAKVSVPCGYRQIVVKKDSYVPYREYFLVEEGSPKKVSVKLKEFKGAENYALSNELIERLRAGKAPVKEEEPSAPASKEEGVSEEEAPEATSDDWS